MACWFLEFLCHCFEGISIARYIESCHSSRIGSRILLLCIYYKNLQLYTLYFFTFQGSGVTELWSDVQVNDGGWHEVKAQFNPSYMEVTVDGVKKFHRPELRQNRHIDLSGLLYFGGIEATKRSRAVSQGVTAAQAAPMGQLGK